MAMRLTRARRRQFDRPLLYCRNGGGANPGHATNTMRCLSLNNKNEVVSDENCVFYFRAPLVMNLIVRSDNSSSYKK
jgi:hypothetical protein